MIDLKKTKCLVLLGLALSAAAGVSCPARAASPYEVSLDIAVETDTSKPVVPREEVPFLLYVVNRAEPCWIRVRAVTSSTGIGDVFTDAYLNCAEGWVRRGDYYYLTAAAPASSKTLAIRSFSVPDISSSEGGTITIGVWAEGIDFRSVLPDFDSDDPWKGMKPSNVVYYGSDSGGHDSSYSVSVSTGLARFSSPQESGIASTGTWYLEDAENRLWKYGSKARGEYASDGWYYLYNKYTQAESKYQWFYFDKAGYLDVGWINASGNDWYHMHEVSDGDLGSLDKGFLADPQDGMTYYLDQKTGLMKTGWQTIDGKQYYFAEISEIAAANWIYKKIGNTAAGRWFYNAMGLRSYGAMYRSADTPDGRRADENGVVR